MIQCSARNVRIRRQLRSICLRGKSLTASNRRSSRYTSQSARPRIGSSLPPGGGASTSSRKLLCVSSSFCDNPRRRSCTSSSSAPTVRSRRSGRFASRSRTKCRSASAQVIPSVRGRGSYPSGNRAASCSSTRRRATQTSRKSSYPEPAPVRTVIAPDALASPAAKSAKPCAARAPSSCSDPDANTTRRRRSSSRSRSRTGTMPSSSVSARNGAHTLSESRSRAHGSGCRSTSRRPAMASPVSGETRSVRCVQRGNSPSPSSRNTLRSPAENSSSV